MKALMPTRFVRQWLGFVLLLSASGVAAAQQPSFLPALPILVSVAQSPQTNATTTGAQIIMKGVKFQPAELTVKPGETIEFKNEDIFAHTVTAEDGSFDSGLIQPGSSWKMTMPNVASLAFHCSPHPNMKGRLVAAAGEPSEPAGAGHGLPALVPPTRPQELHPILVNFTAALLPLALLSDLLGRLLKRSSLHSAGAWMVLYAALITPLTAAAGWWWKSKSAGALPPDVIAVHQWLGSSLAVLFVVLAVWRWRIYKRDNVPGLAYLGLAAVTALALVYQGSLGGFMVFGK
jgi:plastocyanin/uncharacterized membrane protein